MVEHLQGALALIVLSERVASASKALVDHAKPIRCPFDAEPLTRVTVHNVDVDVCRVHGTWFDAGEVRLIANAFTTPIEGSPAPSRQDSRSTESGDVLVFLDALLDATDER